MAGTEEDQNNGNKGGLSELVDKVNEADTTKLENGKEVYGVGNVRVSISDKDAADFVTGLEQNPTVDPHQEALDRNIEANKGIINTVPMSDTAKDFFNRQIAPNLEKEQQTPSVRSASEIAGSKEGGVIEQKIRQENTEPEDPKPDTSESISLRTAKEIAMDGKSVIEQKLNEPTNNTKNESPQPYIPEGNSLRTAKEIAMSREGVIDKKYSKTPTSSETPVKVESTKDKEGKSELPITVRLNQINNTLESLNTLRAKSPEDPDLRYQVDRLLTNLSVTAGAMVNEIDSKQTQTPKTVENNNSAIIPITPQPSIAEGDVVNPTEEDNSNPNPEVELTPEQTSQILGKRIEELEGIDRTQRNLTDDEIIELFRLEKEKTRIDEALGRVEQERQEKLNKRMKWVKLVSGAAGAGLAIAIPGVSTVAAIAASVGGRMIGKNLRKWSNNLRKKSSDLKYEDPRGKTSEEIAEMKAKQERNEKWADRLEYAASAVTAFGTGFSLGELAQGIFGAAQQALGGSKAVAEGSSSVGNSAQNVPSGGASSGTSSLGASSDAGIGNTASQATEAVSRASISPSETGLIQNGRVNLPGSSWDGNLAGGPTGTMPGGEYANINYPGGRYNMAPFQFNKDIADAGLRVTDLTDKMGTGGVHRLIFRYLENIQNGIMNPDLKTVLGSMTDTPGASDVLNMIQ